MLPRTIPSKVVSPPGPWSTGWREMIRLNAAGLGLTEQGDALIDRIEKDRITVLPGPPTLFVSLLDALQQGKRDLSSLRATITGAAAVDPSLIDRIRNEIGFEIVLAGYGLTETCGIVTLCAPDDDAAGRPQRAFLG